ncbi:hypothetical protein C8R44DRAFT_894227 [Mycena epipterygia]|nr:hypothetical protein C8R44DRAFT_894227 [Mycena epipterygia]
MTNIRAVLLEDHPQIYCRRYYSYNIETSIVPQRRSILAILALSSSNMRLSLRLEGQNGWT